MERAIVASEMTVAFLGLARIVGLKLYDGSIFNSPEEGEGCDCCGRFVCLRKIFTEHPTSEDHSGEPNSEDGEVKRLTNASKSVLRSGLAWISTLICIAFMNYSLGLCLFWITHAVTVPLLIWFDSSPLQRRELLVEAIFWAAFHKLIHPGPEAGFAISIAGTMLWWGRAALVRVGDFEATASSLARNAPPAAAKPAARVEVVAFLAFLTLSVTWSAIIWVQPLPDDLLPIVPLMSWVSTLGGWQLCICYAEVFDVPYTKWFRVSALALPCSLVLQSRWAAPLCLGLPRLTTPLRMVAFAGAAGIVFLQRWLSIPIFTLVGLGLVVREAVSGTSARAWWSSPVDHLRLAAREHPTRFYWWCAVFVAALIAATAGVGVASGWLVSTVLAFVGGLVACAYIVDYFTVRRYLSIRASLANEETEQQRAARLERWRLRFQQRAASKTSLPRADSEPGTADADAVPDGDAIADSELSDSDDRDWPVSGRQTKRTAAMIAGLLCFALEAAWAASSGSFRRVPSPYWRFAAVFALGRLLLSARDVLARGTRMRQPVAVTTSEPRSRGPQQAGPNTSATPRRRR